jgi:hypothetical protein
MEISQNFLAFLEYMNFNEEKYLGKAYMDLIYTAMFVYLLCSSSTKAAAVGEAVEATEELATGGC